MLESIRKGANSWLAKALLGLVALSFVYWGADTKSNSTAGRAVATIGKTQISVEDYQRAYDNELNSLSQRAGRRVTAAEARAYGLDRQTVSRLVGLAAIDSHAKTLNLSLSDATIAGNIQSDPGFKGLDGKFDRSGFDAMLRNLGLNERGFIERKRLDDVRDQLTGTLVNAIVTPKPIVSALHNWREESRVIEHLTLDGEKAVKVADADATKLKETYEANKAQFMAPEYRKLQVLLLSVEELKKDIAISDADLAKSYEETKDSYATPELRRVQQIAFKDKAAATAAKEAIKGGKNFMTIAEENGAKPSDVEIGLVNRKALLDPKIGDAAFALAKDAVSDVIDGKFATVLLRVPEIQPGKSPTLDEVKDRVKEKLARQRAKDEIAKLREQIDDLRNAGKTSIEISQTLKLKVIDIAATDAKNQAPDGKPASDLPDAKALMASGFDVKSGIDREAVELIDGGYGWVETGTITPPRQKPYEEVEADVKTLYLTNERRRLLLELARKLTERIGNGETMAAIATELGTKVETTLPITRSTLPQGLNEAAVAQAFALAAGKAGSVDATDKKGRTIIKVADIKPAPTPTKEQLDRLNQEVARQVQIDTVDAYVSALQTQLGATVNEAELRRLSGAATQ
jgi:peptidyl-prolyl cis-trans isomerase D